MADDVENEHEEDVKIAPKKQGFLGSMMTTLEKKYPKLMELLKDIRVQAFLLFLILLIFYLNLIIWDFYFSSDSVEYRLIIKSWFDGKDVDNYDLFRPAHPLTTPLAIIFSHLTLPFVGSNYLLSFAILDAILGSGTVGIFYLFCHKVVGNRKFALICSLGLAFSFAFWENCEMAEDKTLGFLIMTLYLPLLFAYVGEFKFIKRYNTLKAWQRGFITGIFMGLTLSSHTSFFLLFIASLIIIWRYEGLKSFKGIKFIFYLIGAAVICGIVFGGVAYALNVGSLSEFIGMFTKHHGGDSEYFVLANPETFSITTQFRDLAGGVFTTFLMFISSESVYRLSIIGLGALILLIIAFIMISARSTRMGRSLYIIMIVWFAHYFFFGPGDRNAWVYLLVPIWLIVCIGLNNINNEGIKLPFIKKELPKKLAGYVVYLTIIIVIILLLNNVKVFADAHFNHDVREEFVYFAGDNIEAEDTIMIVDESVTFFFGYYSEIEAVNIIDVVHDQKVSGYINSSFENGTAVYVAEYWFRDSYIKVGTARYEQTYESRLQRHREDIASFNAIYVYETIYIGDWSDIYQITELNQSR